MNAFSLHLHLFKCVYLTDTQIPQMELHGQWRHYTGQYRRSGISNLNLWSIQKYIPVHLQCSFTWVCTVSPKFKYQIPFVHWAIGGVTSMLGVVHTHHGNYYCSLPGDVYAHHGKGQCFWNSCNILFRSKKPSDSAVVHSSKSKDQSIAIVDKHWCHPIHIRCIWDRKY